MALGALIDLGLSRTKLLAELRKLPIKGYSLKVCRESRAGIGGCRVRVKLEKGRNEHRGLADIKGLLEKSRLKDEIKSRSIKVFESLARAEAKIHRKRLQEIRFHEVGALDCIVDVVGVMAGLELLGISRISASKIPLGRGWVSLKHGNLPLPAPATMEMLKDVPVYSSPVEGELVTPTGAAILTNLTREFGNLPSMKIEKVGYGVGDRDYPAHPNLLRIVLGREDKKEGKEERIVIIETNIDNMNPELYDNLIERLFQEGALDVYLTNIQMKKARPGIMLSVLAREEQRTKLTEIIFQESTSIGIRFYPAGRHRLSRRVNKLKTPYGEVRVKISEGERGVMNLVPEYDDCKKLAKRAGIPLKIIYREVQGRLAQVKGLPKS